MPQKSPAAGVEDAFARARAAVASQSSGRGTVELSVASMMGHPMRGTYVYASGDRLRMELEGYGIRATLVENGRDLWNYFEKDNTAFALRLQVGPFTAAEYDQARWIGGIGGIPWFSPPKILKLLDETKPVKVSSGLDRGRMHDVYAAPAPSGSPIASLMFGIQTELMGGEVPDSLWISIRRDDGVLTRVRGVRRNGSVLSDLAFLDHQAAPADEDLFRFFPPDRAAVLHVDSLWMERTGGPKWLQGRKLPDLSVETADARRLNVTQASRPRILNFWATWCGPCRLEWPVLQKLFDKYGKDAEFYLVTNDPVASVRTYKEKFGYTAPTYFEGKGLAASRLAVNAIPVTMFISKDGIVRSVHVGFARYPSEERTRLALFDTYDRILSEMLQ